MSEPTVPIRAEGLVRRFGELVAVDGVDIEVADGEIFGFLGPNGAGKSTTVRMLTTLLRPTAGRASVAGFDVVRQANQVRSRIGVALQDAAIDPLMTGRELLSLQAVLHGLGRSAAKERGERLLERVGLEAAGDRRVETYSGGMRRRLDLALSLIHEPEVLFLDEPTTGLDPTSRQALWAEVRRLNDEGTTVFLTTQYLEEADELAGRIAIIDGGRIIREGAPDALKAAVGAPTLRLTVGEENVEAARTTVERFGEARPAAAGRVAIGLAGGATELSAVVSALTDSGIPVDHVELDQPSLDDVFADATGRRLEGADSEGGDGEAQPYEQSPDGAAGGSADGAAGGSADDPTAADSDEAEPPSPPRPGVDRLAGPAPSTGQPPRPKERRPDGDPLSRQASVPAEGER